MKKIIGLLLSAVMIICALTSCANEKGEYFVRTKRNGMGRFSVSLSRVDKDGRGISDAELYRIYEETYATFTTTYNDLSDTPKSGLCLFNAEVETVLDIPESLGDAVDYAFSLSEKTKGLYEPSAGTVSDLIEADPTPSKKALADALSHVGKENFSLEGTILKKSDPLAKLDLGPLRDAYALMAAVEQLKKSECAYGTVTFNGTAGVFGEKADGEAFEIKLSSGHPGAFYVTEGYVSLVSKNFGTAFDFTDGVTEPSLECAAVYSADPRVCCVMASLAYVNGSKSLMEVYREGGLSFEAVLTEKNGRLTLTDKAEKDGLFATERVEEESTKAKEGSK